jgi:type IV pilus assembly protein PilO
MTTTTASKKFDLSGLGSRLGSQFKGLNFNQPGQWPLLPRAAAWLLVTLLVLALGYALVLADADAELEAERNREPTLKQDLRLKMGQAVNLNELKKQKLQVQEYVTQLEKQLPGKAEMDALLSDINQAGLGRGLQFELFRPGNIEVKDYYAELPIALKVTGKYHDFGAFGADVANLSRIVTLHNLSIGLQASKDNPNLLSMEATARTYRYLDANEVAEQAKKVAAAKAANATNAGGGQGGKK